MAVSMKPPVAGEMDHLVKHLLCKHVVLSLDPRQKKLGMVAGSCHPRIKEASIAGFADQLVHSNP